MRIVFKTKNLLLFGLLLELLGTQIPASGRCSCLKGSDDTALRSAVDSAISHLPSQSSLVTAREFAAQQLPIDAAEYYVKAAEQAEAEIDQASKGTLPKEQALVGTGIPYLKEHALNVDLEAISFLRQSGHREVEETTMFLRESAFAHMVDLGTEPPGEVSRLSKALAADYAQIGKQEKSRQYWDIALHEIERNQGRYSAEFAETRRMSQSAQLSSSSPAQH